VPETSPQPKRRRGGQLGNQNARKYGTFSTLQPGPLAEVRQRLDQLWDASRSASLPPHLIEAHALSEREKVNDLTKEHAIDSLDAVRLEIRITGLVLDSYRAVLHAFIKQRALESIAHDAFGYIERHYGDLGISRDTDSFFIVSKLSARNSRNLGDFPPQPGNFVSEQEGGGQAGSYATDLTDEQWAILAPLVPPVSSRKPPAGEPPVIIAANRIGLTRYSPTGEFNDFLIMEKYREFCRQYPVPAEPSASPVKRGRPHKPPLSSRALLNAIFWKLATGHTWDELPLDFPPMRTCRKYYRRLFLSGRFYTILLALYNHMRLEACIDPFLLLEQGVFTTTPDQHIALSSEAAPTWQNYTALLFLQIARDAYLYFERQEKQNNPFYTLLPSLKGDAELSNGRLPHAVDSHILTFEPLNSSSAHKKWRQIEKRESLIKRKVKNGKPPSPSPDT